MFILARTGRAEFEGVAEGAPAVETPLTEIPVAELVLLTRVPKGVVVPIGLCVSSIKNLTVKV
jgi:hypothetical protein